MTGLLYGEMQDKNYSGDLIVLTDGMWDRSKTDGGMQDRKTGKSHVTYVITHRTCDSRRDRDDLGGMEGWLRDTRLKKPALDHLASKSVFLDLAKF